MKKTLIILVLFLISHSVQGENVFGYSSFECKYDYGYQTTHSGESIQSEKNKIDGFTIRFDDVDIKYNDNEYKEATVTLFSDENESVKIPYITVFRNDLSINFIEGTSHEASTILTTIYDYWVSDGVFTSVRSTHTKGITAESMFTQHYGYCKGIK